MSVRTSDVIVEIAVIGLTALIVKSGVMISRFVVVTVMLQIIILIRTLINAVFAALG